MSSHFLPSPRNPNGHWHLYPRNVSTQAENSLSFPPVQHPCVPVAHSSTSISAVKQAAGSVTSEKPAHRPRVTAPTSRRPRYWAPLMTTVGTMRILEEPKASTP